MELDTSQIDRLRAAVSRLRQRMSDTERLTAAMGPVLQRQTQTRITDEKTDPSGKPWKKWSPSYAATRNATHSLLIDTRAMVNTIEWRMSGDEVTVGSSRPYAGYVDNVRQFVGLSDGNERELEMLALRILESYLEAA